MRGYCRIRVAHGNLPLCAQCRKNRLNAGCCTDDSPDESGILSWRGTDLPNNKILDYQ
jgi:hypothetical protein